MAAFEHDFPFCGNAHCELHVCAGDARVEGFGNWAEMPDGRIVGRGLYDGIFLCDGCGRAAIGRTANRAMETRNQPTESAPAAMRVSGGRLLRRSR